MFTGLMAMHYGESIKAIINEQCGDGIVTPLSTSRSHLFARYAVLRRSILAVDPVVE